MFFCDVSKCDNCARCIEACALSHHGRTHMFVQSVGALFVPANCRHCERSPCAEVCPTGACARTDEGVVRIAPMKCVGCRLCAIACPFGAIWFDALDKVSRKCEQCLEWRDGSHSPACVEACMERGALHFGAEQELRERARGEGGWMASTRAGGEHGTLVLPPTHVGRAGEHSG
jgi:Fe-S-cluster-containing dehydrogenase component